MVKPLIFKKNILLVLLLGLAQTNSFAGCDTQGTIAGTAGCNAPTSTEIAPISGSSHYASDAMMYYTVSPTDHTLTSPLPQTMTSLTSTLVPINAVIQNCGFGEMIGPTAPPPYSGNGNLRIGYIPTTFSSVNQAIKIPSTGYYAIRAGMSFCNWDTYNFPIAVDVIKNGVSIGGYVQTFTCWGPGCLINIQPSNSLSNPIYLKAKDAITVRALNPACGAGGTCSALFLSGFISATYCPDQTGATPC